MASPCSSFLPPPAPLSSSLPAHSPSPESPSMLPKPEILLLPAPEPKPPSPPRKTQPLPWSHQETLALIEAYQEKWYSLKKGPLKASQWEEVAAGVAARCGFDNPSKTANQCRNKIEKLRRRYRFELKSRKPVPSSWQYFGLMYQMECGPLPLDAHPIAYVKLSPRNTNSNATNNNIFSQDNNGDDDDNVNRSYSNLYSGSGYYYNNNGRRDVGGSDESDEEWNNTGYGVETAKKNKSKSINHIVLDNVKRGVRSARRAAMDRGFGGGSDKFARELRDQMNGKRKQYYGGEDSDDEDDDDENDGEEDEERGMQVDAGGGDGVVGKELAAEIRGFADMFMGMEKRKIEMIREMERYRMEMEKKRMEMILVAQRKIVDTVGWAFEAHKKPKMSQES